MRKLLGQPIEDPRTPLPAPAASLRRPCASISAFPKAVLAPSAILQPRQHPAKMSLLLPEAGRPALSPGHSPPPGAPGYPTGVRTTHQPSTTLALPTFFPTQLLSTPGPSSSLLGTLGPPSLLQGEAVGTPSLPRGPEGTSLGTGLSSCRHQGATYESGSRWSQPGCSQCLCQVGVKSPGLPWWSVWGLTVTATPACVSRMER